MSSPAVIKATDGGTQRYGLSVSSLQENIQIIDDAISGTLKLIDAYSGFGGSEANTPGYYLALDVEVPDGATVTTKVEGGTNANYVDLTTDKFCVYRIKDNKTQKIKIKTQKDDESVEKTYDLTGLILLEGPVGEAAFDKTKIDYGNFGKNTDFYDGGSVTQAWNNTKCTVTGTLNWVKKGDTTSKLGSDGNYFAFKLVDKYKDKSITVDNGGTAKTATDTDWVCLVSEKTKTGGLIVKCGDTLIASFDLSGVTLKTATT